MLKEAVKRIREGNIHIVPGYDGEFGKIQIFTENEKRGEI
jgi:PHP family Zn ribbon phosphoesterase